ncbi:hypothetical protein KA005_51180 [bacterium]|nr:hypothetical protein [bacterium]
MIPGALDCKNCNLKFHFMDRQAVQDVIDSLRNGGTASPAILREVRCYILDKDNYPFKGVREQ